MQKKKGISLIVLIVTIIVMIILASTTIISLNGTNIIVQANEAVDKTNLQQVQNIANMAWIESYLDNKKTKADLEQAVKDALEANDVIEGKYDVVVTEQGVKAFEIHEEYIKNKLNGAEIENKINETKMIVEYRYEFLENKEVVAITLINKEVGLETKLSEKSNWKVEGMETSSYPLEVEFYKIGTQDVEKGTIRFVAEKINSDMFCEYFLKFEFSDSSIATDNFKFWMRSNEPA